MSEIGTYMTFINLMCMHVYEHASLAGRVKLVAATLPPYISIARIGKPHDRPH
jgi:hypothetical protein